VNNEQIKLGNSVCIWMRGMRLKFRSKFVLELVKYCKSRWEIQSLIVYCTVHAERATRHSHPSTFRARNIFWLVILKHSCLGVPLSLAPKRPLITLTRSSLYSSTVSEETQQPTLARFRVGRAPAALNFAADTGWDTDWLRLERAWAPKWRMFSSENRNKKHPVNHCAVVVVDFCVQMRFCLGCCAVNQSHCRFLTDYRYKLNRAGLLSELVSDFVRERIDDLQGRD